MYIFNISLVTKTKINIKFSFFYKKFKILHGRSFFWLSFSESVETKNLTTCFHLELAQTCKTYKSFIESRKLKVFACGRAISLSRNVEVSLKEVGLIELSVEVCKTKHFPNETLNAEHNPATSQSKTACDMEFSFQFQLCILWIKYDKISLLLFLKFKFFLSSKFFIFL